MEGIMQGGLENQHHLFLTFGSASATLVSFFLYFFYVVFMGVFFTSHHCLPNEVVAAN
jgi:hypothetical protein